MTASLLRGHDIAAEILADARRRADEFAARCGRRPRLVSVHAALDAGVERYLARQRSSAGAAGVEGTDAGIPAGATTQQAAALVRALAADPMVDGVALLFPLPPSIEPEGLVDLLDPRKDVDGLHPRNAGLLTAGREAQAFVPCTAMAAVTLAERTLGRLRGVPVTVVGASIRVGRPLAQLLLNREATVTVAHVATRDLEAACRGAELLFVAAGRAGLIRGSAIRPGAVVIDIGINPASVAETARPGTANAGATQVVGDVDFASASAVASSISAVPDGVGPITTAFLMANTVHAALSVALPSKTR